MTPTLAAVLVIAMPASAGTARTVGGSCRVLACQSRIVIADGAKTEFSTIEVFRPRKEKVSVRLIARGHELSMIRRSGPFNCFRRFRGSGMAARVSVCGRKTPVNVTAWPTRGAGGTLYLLYRGRSIPQAVLSVHGSSGTQAGGISGPRNPGGIGFGKKK